ncbi:MAG: site-2 protease family protein, partial [Chloroflexi bacterium]|nr:site-2 protease family protein [Chloroflexota bacterium]
MIEMQQAGSAFETLRRALEEVMTIESITRDGTDTPLRARGELTLPADKAFDRLRPVYEQFGYTPRMYKDEGTVVIDALPGVFGQEDYGIPWGPILLFIVTLISVFFVGANMSDELPVPFLQALALQMGAAVEGVPDAQIPTTEQFNDALMMGVLYAGSLLGILGAHEMGHFLMARRHKVDTTPPFFIPLPINILGTLGAVIAMREPAPNRRIQFDIGVAGPIAGLIVTVPVLIIGLTLSEVRSRQEIIDELPTAQLDPAIIEPVSYTHL